MNSGFFQWLDGASAWTAGQSMTGALLAIVLLVALGVARQRVSPAWRFALVGLVLVKLMLPSPVNYFAVGWHMDLAEELNRETGLGERTGEFGRQSAGVQENARRVQDDKSGQVGIENLATIVIGEAPVAPEVKVLNAGGKLNSVVEPKIWSWRRVLSVGWIVIAGLMLVRLAMRAFRMHRSVGRLRMIADEAIVSGAAKCARDLGMKRMPALKLLPGLCSPAVVGWIRPTILLSSEMVQVLGENEMRMVLMHELAHVRRRDVLWNGLGNCVLAIHWFNPMAWWLYHRLGQERELACDEMALSRMIVEKKGQGATVTGDMAPTEIVNVPGREYACTLLKILDQTTRDRSPRPAVGLLANKSQIQRRLLMIMRYGQTSRRRLAGCACALLIGAGGMVGIGFAQAPGADKPVKVVNPTTATTGKATAGRAPGVGKFSAQDVSEPAAVVVPGLVDGKATPVKSVAVKSEKAEQDRHVEQAMLKGLPEVKFSGQGLGDAIDWLRDESGMNIIVDWEGLAQLGVAKDSAVTLSLKNTTVGDAIKLMLKLKGEAMGYEVLNGALVIGPTSKDVMLPMLTRVYDVKLLLNANMAMVKGAGETGAVGGVPGDAAAKSAKVVGAGEAFGSGGSPVRVPGAANVEKPVVAAQSQMEQLIKVITDTVQPDIWATNGGVQGTISSFGTKLIVKTTELSHRDVQALLEMLNDNPGGPAGK